MKNKVLSFALCIFFIGLFTIQKSDAQCTTNASICTSGVAGPFNFVNSGPAVSTCLDWLGSSSTAYIILHINSSGPLNMLIDGNLNTGYLDVAVFNIPPGQAPCSAIQNNANQLGCNYASANSGCNQFGNAFSCGSSVPAPNVVAGQDLMIVVENWQGSANDFTLSLGPVPGAQTGPPNATVTGGTGPFCTTSPASQLIAADNGGTWSGPGTSASGMFNPATAGPGAHTINYSIGVPPCNSTSTTTIIVNPPTALSISPSATSICAGQSVTLTASGASSYSWATGGQTTSSITVSPGSATTYTVTAPGCSSSATQTISVTPAASAAWSQPPAMCVNDAAINLNTFVTGTAGGTWSGSGVSGNMFNPSGLSGSIPVTYTVGTSPCGGTSTLNITVNPNTPPTITSVPNQCSGSTPFNLTADIAGGTWSGTGITNAATGTFDPSQASTSSANTITYTLSGSCGGSDNIQITVIAGPDATWSPATLCTNNTAISLDSLLSGTAGGTWSGSGVTGNMFNPSGLSGGIPVTYTVGGACTATATHNITCIPMSDPSWNTTSICQVSSILDLNTLVTGTSGGSWSGTGVSGNSFDPSGLSGNIAVTYTAGTSPCQSVSTQNISVIPVPDASWTTPSTCSDASAINLDTTITGTSGGTWSGNSVTGNLFDPTGLSGAVSVTYTVGPVGCQSSSSQNITVIPAGNAAWTTTAVCTNSAPIDLNTLITGTTGGTWNGTGVMGNMFDPAGLTGNIAIEYLVGTVPCQDSLTQNIIVAPLPSAAWSAATVCSDATPISLDSLVTGTTGGTWSGNGVTGSSFSPTGLSGNIAVTYNIGPAGCSSSQTQNITIVPVMNPAWTTTSLCSNSGAFNLNSLITGTSGGTWSGTGVSGNTFNPSGLSGNVSITYLVGTAPCQDSLVQSIAVTPSSSSAWTAPAFVCSGSGALDLNTTITGTTGGTWSGTGVSGNTFNPSGLNGSIAITYTVGTSPCIATSTQSIIVGPDADATINAVSPMCQNSSSVTLTAANNGGVWAGSGITNTSAGTFNPNTANAGVDTITYTIGGACGDIDTLLVTVIPNPSSAWSMPSNICESAGPVDLNTLVTGAPGGTFTGNGVTGSIYDPQGLSGNGSITYSVTQNGCSSTSTQICNVDAINASFTATPLSGMAPVNVTTLNTSTNAVGYLWNFGNGDTTSLTNATSTYTSMGDYTIILTAVNANGCIDTARLTIHIDELSALAMPNVFTPNGDGNNDMFKPVIAEGIREFKATIYDRWGLKLQELNSKDHGWDGRTSAGKTVPDGTYYYVVSGKGVDGKVYEFKGFVQLYN
jgi:trimeric autotransporter adhesin